MIRVVVTGVGAISPLGVGALCNWGKILASKSGIKSLRDGPFDVSDLSCKIAGFIQQSTFYEQLKSLIGENSIKKMDKFIHFGLLAAQESINDSGIADLPQENKARTGVLIGSGIGGLSTIENNANILHEKGARRISPFFIPASLINLISGHVSMLYGFRGPNHSVVTACSTGTHAIGDAMRIIRDNDADVMVCGGAEGAICRLGMAGFAAARALSTNYNDTPEKASRPWDKDRDGFVMGEGSGVVVLENYEHAKKRGAKIYGEVVGYGMSGDAYHITAPHPEGQGAISSMNMALQNSKVDPSNIGYINAHGTSTPAGDILELNAIKAVFKDDVKNLAISSTKSSIGHLLGAAGSVEAIISLLAMKEGVLPPTLNLDNPDERCEGINLVPHIPQEKKVGYVMSNSFGFGGTNSTLVFKKI